MTTPGGKAPLLLFLLVLLAICIHNNDKTSLMVAAQTPTEGKQLKQIHVITRHGSRTMLPKNADNLMEEEGATLTPLGQSQLYQLGTWLRQEYSNVPNNLLQLDYYNPSHHRLESTNLDRTLSSANSLALGLFPSAQRATGILYDDAITGIPTASLMTSSLSVTPAIPVYSMQEDNDVYLRAFKNCPTFLDNLQVLYDTEVWKQLESLNDDLLRKLATIFPDDSEDGRVPLKNLWNVYDALHVAVTECTANETACDALVPLPSLATALSTSDYAALELLTHQVEHFKYAQTETAGNLLGSNLLWKILQRAGDQENGGTFFLYSAHAATILGLLATLQASEDFVSATRGERFVDYGGALIFEVYNELLSGAVAPSQFIRLKYKSLTMDDAVRIPLKQTANAVSCGGGEIDVDDDSIVYCQLEEFTVWSVQHTLAGATHWCEACGNESSDICLRAKYLPDDDSLDDWNYDNDGESSGGSGGWDGYGDLEVTNAKTSDPNYALIVAATFLGGLLAGTLLMLLVGYLCILPKFRATLNTPPEGKDGLTTPPMSAEKSPSNGGIVDDLVLPNGRGIDDLVLSSNNATDAALVLPSNNLDLPSNNNGGVTGPALPHGGADLVMSISDDATSTYSSTTNGSETHGKAIV